MSNGLSIGEKQNRLYWVSQQPKKNNMQKIIMNSRSQIFQDKTKMNDFSRYFFFGTPCISVQRMLTDDGSSHARNRSNNQSSLGLGYILRNILGLGYILRNILGLGYILRNILGLGYILRNILGLGYILRNILGLGYILRNGSNINYVWVWGSVCMGLDGFEFKHEYGLVRV